MTKLSIRENALAYQATKNTRKEKGCKVLINVKDREIKAHEHSQLTLEESIKRSIVEFPPEEGQEDEDWTAKVGWLLWIVMELKKQVEEIKE